MTKTFRSLDRLGGMRVAFLAAAVIFGSLTLSAQAQIPAPTVSPTAVAVATVHITGFAYAPGALRVKAGDAVLFVNDDDAAHTVTASDGSFDSGYLAKGDRWTHTFAAAGSFAYICTYHPFMKGTVTVTAP